MRMRAAHLWSRIEGGPARAAAGDHARARVSESQSFTSAQRALTHHTSDHISNTPTQDTVNGNATRKRRTRHTGHARRTPTRSRGRYRCRGTGAGRDTRERCKKAERLSRQGTHNRAGRGTQSEPPFTMRKEGLSSTTDWRRVPAPPLPAPSPRAATSKRSRRVAG